MRALTWQPIRHINLCFPSKWMILTLSSVLLCMYTLSTCVGFVGLVYWIQPAALGVCS